MEEEGGEGSSQTKEQEDSGSHTKELDDEEDRSYHAKEVEDKVVRSSYTKNLEDMEDMGEDREKPAVPARPQLDHQVGGHSGALQVLIVKESTGYFKDCVTFNLVFMS